MMRSIGAATLVAAMAASAAVAQAADWPSYGRDLANSRNAVGDGPSVAQVTGISQAWRFDTSDGDFTGTPAVAGGTLVAGSGGGTIVALDAVTGRVRWSRDVNQSINGSAAISTALGIGYVPIARHDTPHLLALSLRDGSTVWDTVLTNQPTSDVFGSPVVWRGRVYMGTSADSGDNSTSRGAVVALDARTGNVDWRTFMVPPGDDGGSVWSTPAIDTATGRLFVGTGNAYHAPAAPMTDSVVALDAATGAVLAHHQATPGDVFSSSDNPAGPDADFGASPNLLTGPDGRALVGDGQKSGVYWAFDRTTLAPVWDTTIGPASPGGGIVGSTAFDGARIYGPNTPGSELWALDHAGMMSWVTKEPGPATFAPVTTSHGVVYLADSSGVLAAHDAASGQLLTVLPLGAPSFGGVAVVGGAVYAAVGTSMNGSGSIVAFGDTSRSGAPGSEPGGGRGGRPGGGPGGGTRSRLRLTVRPRRVRAGHRVTLRFTVRAGGRPVRGALIRVGTRHARTGGSGRARLRLVLHKPGRRKVVAKRRGFGSARARLAVVRRRR